MEVSARYQPGCQPDPDDHLLQDQTGTDSGGKWAKQVTRTHGNTDVTAAWPKCSRGPPGSRCVRPSYSHPQMAGSRKLEHQRSMQLSRGVWTGCNGGHVWSDGLRRRTCSEWGKAQEKACKNLRHSRPRRRPHVSSRRPRGWAGSHWGAHSLPCISDCLPGGTGSSAISCSSLLL